MEQERKDIGEANESNREILEITGDSIYEAVVEYGRQCGPEVCLHDLLHDSFWAWDKRPEDYCPNSGLTSFLCARFAVTPDQIEIAMHKDAGPWYRYTVMVGSEGAGVLFDSDEGQALIPSGKNTLEADDFEE